MKRIPLKHVATLNDEVLPESFHPDGLIKYAEVSDVSQGRPIQWKEPMPFVQAPSRARRIVKHDDILISTVRTYLRAVTQVEYPPTGAVASTGFAVVRPRIADSKYLGYVLQSDAFIDEVVSESVGVSYPAISSREIARIKIPFPEIEKQKKIADFLVGETAEIDAFIADQERLIELLEERRTATITHAVTKGLDPNAPMKDSGVEWIGRVPESWSIKKIKWLSRVNRGASPRPIDDPKYFSEDGIWSWVRISDVTASDGRLRETTQKLSSLGASKSVKLNPGALFVSIAATVGKPCITEIQACIHDGFVYFPDLSQLLSLFLYRVFEGGQCYKGLGKLGTQLNLNTETIGSIKIPVPREDEILEILSMIDKEISVIDAAVSDAREAIGLSRERRGALISAAVTGQIDVTQQARPVGDESVNDEVWV